MSGDTIRIAKHFEVLANPMRVAILKFLLEDDAGWNDLKRKLEKAGFGRVNPNTLAFHLTRLIEHGFVEKRGSPESPIYSLRIEKNKLERLLREAKEVTS